MNFVLQILTEWSFRKKVSSSMQKRNSANPDNGLNKFKTSIEEMSSKCRSNTSRWAPNQINLTAISRQCGRERNVRNSKKSSLVVGATEAKEL